MKRKILPLLLAVLLVLGLFAGCGAAKEPTTVTNVSPEQAQEIARKALGITEEQMLSPFIHTGTYGDNQESAYSILFATLEKDYEFVISAVDGEILYRSDEAPQQGG